jgi:NAD+ synthase (glutamine-hydrolysing)
MHPAGFLRISTVSTSIAVANPEGNATAIEQALVSFQSSDIVLLPELCISGYTCGELFLQDRLLDSCRSALVRLASINSSSSSVCRLRSEADFTTSQRCSRAEPYWA